MLGAVVVERVERHAAIHRLLPSRAGGGAALVIGFILFAIVASFTPGPTNILVMACAARRGLGAVLPLVAGSACGAAGMVWAAGLGLTAPLSAHPWVQHLLSAVGIAWLGRLAWQLFRSAGEPAGVDSVRQACPGALTGAGLQLVNPKTWMMALAVVGVFAPAQGATVSGASGRAAVFLIIAAAGLTSWALIGRYGIGGAASPGRQRLFNRAMAVLLLFAAGLSLVV